MSRKSLELEHPPTSHQDVAGAIRSGDHRDVTLWRGGKQSQAENVELYGTAGGVRRRDENTPAPTTEEARTQVAGGSLAGGKRTSVKPTEYTTSMQTADTFGKSNVINGQVNQGMLWAARVNTKYLAAGSRSEGGFTLHKTAPVKVLGMAEGEMGVKYSAHNSKFANADAG